MSANKGIVITPFFKISRPQFFIIAKGARLFAALDQFVAFSSGQIFHGLKIIQLSRLFIHVQQFISVHVRDIDQLIHILKKFPDLLHLFPL